MVVAFCVAIAGLMAGCDSDFGTEIEAGFGPFEGMWDGVSWNGRGYAVLVNDTLYVFGHRRPIANQFYDETVHVTVPFAGAGTYAVSASYAELGKVTGGDAGYFASVAGELVLTAADLTRMQIDGSLELQGNGPDGLWRLQDVRFDLPVYSSFSQTPQAY